MASALADAAAPIEAADRPGTPTDSTDAEDGGAVPPSTPAGRPGRLWRLSVRRPAIALRRPNPRGWIRTQLSAGRRRWARRAVTLGLAVALILVSSSAAPLPNGSSSSGSTPGASGNSTATVDRSGESASPVTSPGGAPSLSASNADLTAEPISGTIPTQTSPTATITFNGLMLDSAADSAGSARTFSFVSDGPGLVSAQIVATSPVDSTMLCIALDAARRVCSTGATPDVAQIATAAHSHWTVTLISAGASQPTVDLAMSWPADHPSVSLDHGRFQGAPNPDSLRTLAATFKPRGAGKLMVAAAWSPAGTDATITLTDASGAGLVIVDTATYSGQSSITPAYSHAVAAGRTYRIALFNDGPDTVRMNLTATIEFP